MTLAEAFNQVNLSTSSRSELIKYIYNNTTLKNVVTNYVINHGGNSDEATFVFNDMIVQFIKTAFGPKAQDNLVGELEPYLVGIARHLWYAEIKRKEKHAAFLSTVEMEQQLEPGPEELFITSERKNVLFNLLENLRGNCRAVLMHWANGFSMQEIAEKLNYQSEGMARKKKSHCLSELNEYLMQYPQIKNLLLA
jgi:RNA polymerase sigma factor (sigma-70 family)